MAAWAKTEIVLANGELAVAQAPVIVSASRSTDVPAFYSDWFMHRLRTGFVKWHNPFNGAPLYVSFDKARLFVFWSKNPAPMLAKVSGRNESPIDILEREGRNYYFQFTLNDYDAEMIEPNVPRLDDRIRTFVELSKRIGHHARERIVWRFDPLILTDTLTPKALLGRIRRIGDRIAPCTSRLVFSFIDIKSYARVAKNLEHGGIAAREFNKYEMLEIAEGIVAMTREWNMTVGTCAESVDLPGVEHNRCIDDRLMVKCFAHDAELMNFIGAKLVPGDPLFGESDRWVLAVHRKDPGQRASSGCVMSKDIGEYSTCPHLCHYCYANAGSAVSLANWQRHKACPQAETILG